MGRRGLIMNTPYIRSMQGEIKALRKENERLLCLTSIAIAARTAEQSLTGINFSKGTLSDEEIIQCVEARSILRCILHREGYDG